MAEGKMQAITGMSTRQKVIIVAFIIILLIIIWQVIGLFSSGDTSAPPAPITTTTTTTMRTGAPMTAANPAGAPGTMGSAPVSPMQQQPQNAQLIKQEPMSQREMELMKLQQETQARYIEALNELQLLKVSKDIAETNQAIAKAKLETIAAQKDIVNMLAPPRPVPTQANYASGLVNPVTSGAPVPTDSTGQQQPPQQPPAVTTTTTTTTVQEPSYTVVSVSRIQDKWNAVLGYQGNLYNVSIGDVLPADGSKVVSIDKSGVSLLLKNNTRKKISLVPII